MRLAVLLLPWALVGCTFVPGSTDVLRPERDAAPAAVPAEPGADASADGFALDGYKEEQAEADAEGPVDDAESLLGQLGAEGVEVPADPQPPPAAAPAEVVATPVAGLAPAATPAPAGPPRWTPANAVTLSWGLRLVSTVDAATPPRAILGLPDGREEVVKAGDLLPDVGVVVLAVGQDVVQLGQVTAAGDHARVESVFLRAMFPGEVGPR